MRNDPELVNFIEDMPSLESAARSTCAVLTFYAVILHYAVSVQVTLHAVHQFSGGLDQIKQEILRHSKQRDASDKFVDVMKVCQTLRVARNES